MARQSPLLFARRMAAAFCLAGMSVLLASSAAAAAGNDVTADDWAKHAQADRDADKVAAGKLKTAPSLDQLRAEGRTAAAAASQYGVGKILVTISGASSSTTMFDGHAGIAQGSGYRTIEAWPTSKSPSGVGGVQKHNIDWAAKYKQLRYMSVNGATLSNYQNACNQAVTKIGMSFSILPHNTWNQLFYCSHLVYGAWKRTGFNVDTDSFDAIVTPKEIVASSRTTILWYT
ncbi:MAG: hypothetical protein WAU30_09890 [Propionicimonas sp.]